MNRLLVHVEGETEESFVNEILRPHLVGCGYHNVSARLLGNARQRTNRGGIKSWESVRLEIERHLKGDVGVMATTMVDYYALPDSWPGRVKARSAAVGDKPGVIEGALRDDLARRMGAGFDKNRFVPFVTMHEFESLLFSNCSAFARGIGRSKLEGAFQKIRDQFESPEEMNCSPFLDRPAGELLPILNCSPFLDRPAGFFPAWVGQGGPDAADRL